MAKKRICTFVVLSALAVFLLGAEWEEKKKYHYLPEGKKGKSSAAQSKYGIIKKALAPPLSVFEIEPTQPNQIAAERGTRLTIPVNAFVDAKGRPVAGRVTLRVREVIDPLDFVGSGVDLTYFNDKGQREFFQSAGMFRVDAATGDQQVELAPGKKIGIEFPNIVPGDEFWVYRHDTNLQWKRHGHNQSLEGGTFTVGTRRYQIDALNTWWNFDKPLPEIACAEGRIKWDKDTVKKSFIVYSVGISYKGAFGRHLDDADSFRINVHKGALARFLVLHNSGRVGITPVVSVWNKTGYDKADNAAANPCQNVGVISVVPVDETIASDKKRLSEFLGLEVREYRVDYGANPIKR
ncbi:MAG: hypothetical protein U1F16_13700 [Turneriella sp.]